MVGEGYTGMTGVEGGLVRRGGTYSYPSFPGVLCSWGDSAPWVGDWGQSHFHHQRDSDPPAKPHGAEPTCLGHHVE